MSESQQKRNNSHMRNKMINERGPGREDLLRCTKQERIEKPFFVQEHPAVDEHKTQRCIKTIENLFSPNKPRIHLNC